MKSKIEKNLELFKEIVKNSKTIMEVNEKMGYKLNGNTYRFLKSKMDQFGIDYSHLTKEHISVQPEDVISLSPTSTSIRDLIIKIGLNPNNNNYRRQIIKIIEEYNVDISHFTGAGWSLGKTQFTDHRIANQATKLHKFLDDSKYQGYEKIRSKAVINQLILSKKVKYECNICHMKEWQNKPIRLQLDHIDGDCKNNAFTNLRLLCPNCHAQTITFAAGNKKEKQIEKLNKWYYDIINFSEGNMVLDF